MNRVYKKVFWYSFWLYLGSTMYTRVQDSRFFDDLVLNILEGLPLDAFPLQYLGWRMFISTQIGVLSESEVLNLLRTNPDTVPYLQDGTILKHIDVPISDRDYVVLRFKNDSRYSGDVKIYCSCFPYAITEFAYLSYGNNVYSNIVLPYPQFLEQDLAHSSKVYWRWKNYDE